MVEERNFAELAGKFARDNFRKRHEAGLRVGRHGEAALEGSRTVGSAHPSAEMKVSPRLKAMVGLTQTGAVEFAM
jgi:hypothetical protein